MNNCITGNNIFLFYTEAIIASLAFFKLCHKVCNRLCLCKIITGGVKLISKSTLLFIAFNLLAISYTVIILEHLFNISKDDYLVGFIIAIIVFVEHVPICMVVIRRFPILIGRRKQTIDNQKNARKNISGLNNFYYIRNFTDMRCKYDRVLSIVREQLHREPDQGDVFIMMSKNRRLVRMFMYVKVGSMLFEKKFQ